VIVSILYNNFCFSEEFDIFLKFIIKLESNPKILSNLFISEGCDSGSLKISWIKSYSDCSELIFNFSLISESL
jgi:hypothetical protein